MNYRTILWLVGLVLGVVALAEVSSLVVALVMGEPWLPFAAPVALGLALALALVVPASRTDLALDHRSAMLAVTGAWFAACGLGALPFMLHPTAPLGFADAFFESASGFTTTGATVMSGLDAMPRSVLLWRALEQWLGGMGMVLLGVAVFPILGLGGMQLFKAEAPGPTKDKITPRIAETAKILWVLYLGLTVADATLLWVGGMTPFDAICHSMTTLSTGGFSTHDASLSYYDSEFIWVVTTLFMLLGGTNFVLLHRGLTRGISWSGSPELRTYLAIFAGATLVMTVDLRVTMSGDFPTTRQGLVHAMFQTASILTTTGFTTRDYALWPLLSLAALFPLFFVGGMAGSTGGGIKIVRVVVLARVAISESFRLLHPRAVTSIKLGGQVLERAVLMGVAGFFAMWLLLVAVGTVVLCGYGADVLTALTATAVTLGNIGPGLGGVGPSHTFAGFEPGAKLVMSALMIMGRLEGFTVLAILTRTFWQR